MTENKLGRKPFKDPRTKIITESYYPAQIDIIDVGGSKKASQIAKQAVHEEAERIRERNSI